MTNLFIGEEPEKEEATFEEAYTNFVTPLVSNGMDIRKAWESANEAYYLYTQPGDNWGLGAVLFFAIPFWLYYNALNFIAKYNNYLLLKDKGKNPTWADISPLRPKEWVEYWENSGFKRGNYENIDFKKPISIKRGFEIITLLKKRFPGMWLPKIRKENARIEGVEQCYLGDDSGLVISIKIPGDPQQWKEFFEAVTHNNMREMAAADFPDLYESGVVYRPEIGTEYWKTAQELINDGLGDCEDLANYRAAELRLKHGIDAHATAIKTGPGLYHAVVAGPDGCILEDPTKLLKIKEATERLTANPKWAIQLRGKMWIAAYGIPAQFKNDLGIPTVKGFVQSIGADEDPGLALLKAMGASTNSTATAGAGVNSLFGVMPGQLNANTDTALVTALMSSSDFNTTEKNKILASFVSAKQTDKTGMSQLLAALTKTPSTNDMEMLKLMAALQAKSSGTENAELMKLMLAMQIQQKGAYQSGYADPYSTAIKEAAGLLKDEGFREDIGSAGKYLAEGAGNIFGSVFGKSKSKSKSRSRSRSR